MRTTFTIFAVFASFLLLFSGVSASTRSRENDTAEDLSGEFASVTTEHFRVIHQTNACEAEKIGAMLEFVYERFNLVFGEHFTLNQPRERLMWVCFCDSGSFNSYAMQADKMDLSWLSSYYSAKTNAVAIVKQDSIPEPDTQYPVEPLRTDGDGSIMAISPVPEPCGETIRIMHEAAHQLAFNTGLQKRRVMYPLWASEGIATMFEACVSNSCDSLRSGRLKQMHKRRRLISLSEFISITRLPADAEHQKDIYAQAWGLFRFLAEYRNESLRNYLAELYKLEPGRRNANQLVGEFVSAFGPVEQLEKSWQDFLESLSTASQ